MKAFIVEHLQEPLRVERLAEHVSMSCRNFARVFRQELNLTPRKFVMQVRIEAARRWLEDSRASIEEISLRCGFGDPEVMRRSFLRTLNVTPMAYRQRFRATRTPDDTSEIRTLKQTETHHER